MKKPKHKKKQKTKNFLANFLSSQWFILARDVGETNQPGGGHSPSSSFAIKVKYSQDGSPTCWPKMHIDASASLGIGKPACDLTHNPLQSGE